MGYPVRGSAVDDHRHAHIVGFYRDDEDLIDAVGGFFAAGLTQGDAVVAIGSSSHRVGVEDWLDAAGLGLGDIEPGRYVTIDGETMLRTLMRDHRPDADAFRSTLSGVIAEAGQDGRRKVRVFGEMVAMLWERGDVAAAIELETLWNQLADHHDFALFCGYPLAAVEASTALGAVKRICDLHDSVRPLDRAASRDGPGDDLGANTVSRIFVPSPAVLAAVRGFVARTLRRWSRPHQIADAQVVVVELATNAIRHAASPFLLRLLRTETGLRVEVRDLGAALPERLPPDPSRIGGRGMMIVEALSARWGTAPEEDGKTTWAELREAASR